MSVLDRALGRALLAQGNATTCPVCGVPLDVIVCAIVTEDGQPRAPCATCAPYRTTVHIPDNARAGPQP